MKRRKFLKRFTDKWAREVTWLVYSVFITPLSTLPSGTNPSPLKNGITSMNSSLQTNSPAVVVVEQSGTSSAVTEIGLPPLIKFGKEEVKTRVVPDIIAGKKRICLCITEPDAGSDVANLVTEAKKTEDGKHYIVNGEKKWITNGIWSDYFTVAVRTGGPGMKGVSLLLIEKTMPGVSVRRMDCQGVWASGTTYVNFEDVKVPVENLIGKENSGFKVIMTNFNHERLGIIIQANRFSRV